VDELDRWFNIISSRNYPSALREKYAKMLLEQCRCVEKYIELQEKQLHSNIEKEQRS
jgi:hypothetical protein